MEIHFIIGILQSGGAERVVTNLANFFASRGHNVSLITFKEGDRYKLSQKVNRIRLHKKLPIFDYTLLRGLVNLSKFYFYKKNRPEIISSHINRVALTTIPVSLLYKIKIVSSEHSNHSSAKIGFDKRFLWNYLYKYADAVTILTEYDYTFFKEKNKNVRIIANPNSFKRLESQNYSRTKTIIAVGSLDRYYIKGFDNLLNIFSSINQDFPDWELHIIGEGDNGRRYLERKITELNLTKQVYLKGYESQMEYIYRESSIFILTSRYEGLPMALIEATSQGIACIAYDCISGPSEIINNNKSGILVENQNQHEMIDKLKALISDRKLREKLGDNALIESQKFELSKIGMEWELLFKKII